jgi:hypothetical protein
LGGFYHPHGEPSSCYARIGFAFLTKTVLCLQGKGQAKIAPFGSLPVGCGCHKRQCRFFGTAFYNTLTENPSSKTQFLNGVRISDESRCQLASIRLGRNSSLASLPEKMREPIFRHCPLSYP